MKWSNSVRCFLQRPTSMEVTHVLDLTRTSTITRWCPVSLLAELLCRSTRPCGGRDWKRIYLVSHYQQFLCSVQSLLNKFMISYSSGTIATIDINDDIHMNNTTNKSLLGGSSSVVFISLVRKSPPTWAFRNATPITI